MEILKKTENSTLTVTLSGRLDTSTAPMLEAEIKSGVLDGVDKLVLDLKNLEYISSAGLRLVLGLQKTMQSRGGMTVKNVNDSVGEVFEITGFSDILTIE